MTDTGDLLVVGAILILIQAFCGGNGLTLFNFYRLRLEGMNDAEPTKQGLDGTPVKKRTAGFWSILFMVIGVQCGGVSTVWNIGETYLLFKNIEKP